MLVIKIAVRNLLRHKGKSLVVGTILFMGAFIMTLGNATSIGMQRGIEENMVKSFTGHVVIASSEETKDNVLFTPMGKPIKILQDYEKVRDILQAQPYVYDFLPMVRGAAGILGTEMGFMLVFGCNFEDFQRVFNNPIRVVEGELLKNGEHGVLVGANGRETTYNMNNFWMVPYGYELDPENLSKDAKAEGDALAIRKTLAIEGFGETNATNIEIPIKGIIRYRSLNAAMGEISIMDIESFRQAFGYFTAVDIIEEIPVDDQALLAASEDDFFSEGNIFSTDSTTVDVEEMEKKIRTETRVTHQINYDTAAYNYVSVVLNDGEDITAAVGRLNKIFTEQNIPAKALSWKQAAGQIAQLADILQIIIWVFVVLLFIVASVIIMNTLSMAAIERIEELGMMRAVGAQKSFLGKMFFAETFILSGVFGGLGIFAGVILTWIIRPLQIASGGSEIVELIFGGEIFQPALGFDGLVLGIALLALITGIAVILPLVIALRIRPLDAINRQ